MDGAGLVLSPAVDEDCLVADFHRIRWKRHGPLDEVPPRILRELEHDDVAAAHRAAGEEPVEQRKRARGEDELVHDDVVSDQDGLLHGGTRNDEGLQQERAHEEGEHDRHEDGLRELQRMRPARGVRGGAVEAGGFRRQRTSRNIRSHRVRETK